jgi:hypothetical protein
MASTISGLVGGLLTTPGFAAAEVGWAAGAAAVVGATPAAEVGAAAGAVVGAGGALVPPELQAVTNNETATRAVDPIRLCDVRMLVLANL